MKLSIFFICPSSTFSKSFLLYIQLYETPSDAEFDLRSPHFPGMEYNYLHDPHLKSYFQRPNVRRSLERQGMTLQKMKTLFTFFADLLQRLSAMISGTGGIFYQAAGFIR